MELQQLHKADQETLQSIHEQQQLYLQNKQEEEKKELVRKQANELVRADYKKPKISTKELQFHAPLFSFQPVLDTYLTKLGKELSAKLEIKKIAGPRSINLWLSPLFYDLFREFLKSKNFLLNNNAFVAYNVQEVKALLHQGRIGFNCLKKPPEAIEDKEVALVYITKRYPFKIQIDQQKEVVKFTFWFQAYDIQGLPLTDFKPEKPE